MNIVFFGTSEFAIPAFRALAESKHKVVSLVTQPDRKKGRSLKLSPPPMKVVAVSRGIDVYQPQDASSPDSIDYLKKLDADLFVVIAFGQILKKSVLAIPKLYAINLHGSLLPKYRGAAPTNWAVINGDKKTGVTIIRLNEKMDEGDILLNKEILIEAEDTNITINEELSSVGAKAVLEAVDIIEKGRVVFKKQEEKDATYAPKLRKEDGLIRWDESSLVIHNKVRGFIPWPGAYTHYNNKMLKILKTDISEEKDFEGRPPGEVARIIKGKGILTKTADGFIVIRNLQLEGKLPLDADAFLRGHKIPVGHRFI